MREIEVKKSIGFKKQEPLMLEEKFPADIREFIRRYKPEETKYNCLIIDYVDLLPTPGRNVAKVDCGEIVKRVRELAKKYNITFKDLIGR